MTTKPATTKEPGMAQSEAQFLKRCVTRRDRSTCRRLWAGRHGDGPS
jgi:hypothetical protein